MAVMRSGGLWLATRHHGLLCYPDPLNASRETMQEYHHEIGFAGDEVRSLFLEQDDVIWVGTNAGLARCQIETGY